MQVRTRPVSDFSERPVVRGKFLYVGNEKFWVKGVSYGTFLIGEKGEEQLDREVVRRDFALMAEHGFNVVRVHTGPPRWLLDQAQENGLRVMVDYVIDSPLAWKKARGKICSAPLSNC